MPCKSCARNPVITLPNSNVKLCSSCFVHYFERKVFKTVAKYEMIRDGDRIGVAVSGGKDSFSLLYLLSRFADKHRKLSIVVISVDEGIRDYRDLFNVEKYCRENRIEYHSYSFKEEFGLTLDQMRKKTDMNPCSICGILRRFLLNAKSRELKLTKVATGHNLDDEAQSILMNQFRGNLERSARLGPVTGILSDKKFVRRMKPFYLLSEKEVATYSFIKKLPVPYSECPYAASSYRADVRDMLNEFTKKHPQTKHAIINSFLDVLPILKKRYSGMKVKTCKVCGEPTSGDVCTVCKLLESLQV
ncbi:MAG: TIGR00269 family protein [archaeon]